MKLFNNKAKFFTGLVVLVLGLMMLIWANITNTPKKPQANDSTKTASGYLQKQSIKVEVSSGEYIGNRRTRFLVKTSGFKNVSKLFFSIECENETKDKLFVDQNDCKIIEKEVGKDKDHFDFYISFLDYDFTQNSNNKVRIQASNHDFAGVINHEDNKIFPINDENFYYGKAEFIFSKSNK